MEKPILNKLNFEYLKEPIKFYYSVHEEAEPQVHSIPILKMK